MVKHYPLSLDTTFAALADPTRRRILESLSHRQRRVTDLADLFPMSLPAVSKHLRVLEDAGLLKRRRFGREHHLELEPAPMREAQRWIEYYRKFWEESLDALAAYLEKNNQPKKNKKEKKHEHHHSTRLTQGLPTHQSAARARLCRLDHAI